MKNGLRMSCTALAVAVAVVLSAPIFLAAQATSGTAKTENKQAAFATKSADKKPWTLPRTPDGEPDIQGYWTSLSFTPMERAPKYGNKEFLTPEEMAEVFKAGVQHTYEFTFANSAETPVYDATVYALGAWQNGIQPNPRTSLVVDPPDGRIPALTPEAAKLRASRPRPLAEGAETGDIKADDPVDLGLGVRCLSFGGPPILPGAYDSNTHIVQGPGYVVIEYEWNSETRVIPTDGSAHLPADIRPWHGDSRGHWEGNTLVVETTNFRKDATFQNANYKTLKMTEYFTRTNENTIEYKFTVDDPSTWTKPWSAIVPLSHVEGPMFEYACSEGNNGMINILAGARAAEKAGKEKPEGTPISQK